MIKGLIIGAIGTVWAYTSLYLKEKGNNFIAVSSRNTDNNDYGIKYYCFDVRNWKDFEKLSISGLYAVVNLAGMLPAHMDGYYSQQFIDINLTGVLNILEFCARINAERVIYS